MNMNRVYLGISTLILVVLLMLLFQAAAYAIEDKGRVNITLDSTVADSELTGRLFLIVNDGPDPTPREVAGMIFAAVAENPIWGSYAPFFGKDVDEWTPGSVVSMDTESVHGYPFDSFTELPPGDYYVQAVLNVYTRFERSDGHTIWTPQDHWDGQQFHISPGNLFSEVRKISVGDDDVLNIELTLSEKIPPNVLPQDTQFTKRLKFKSELASDFWGQDMYVGATVQLPTSYYDNPERRYPTHYAQGHFQERDRFVVPETRPEVPGDLTGPARRIREGQLKMFDDWRSDDAPQIIAVTFQHPVPYYDNSYLVNSANIGPYGEVLLQELLPAVENNFRTIAEPWARLLSGGSTGGWISAALQLYYPKTFGGTWSFCPDPVDFTYFQLVNIYEDDNAYWVPRQKWIKTEQMLSRSVEGVPLNSVRRVGQLNRALASKGRSAEVPEMWSAIYGPVGDDGYPAQIWDNQTGEIDHEVAKYWRKNGYDLRHFAEENWSKIGHSFAGYDTMTELHRDMMLYLKARNPANESGPGTGTAE